MQDYNAHLQWVKENIGLEKEKCENYGICCHTCAEECHLGMRNRFRI